MHIMRMHNPFRLLISFWDIFLAFWDHSGSRNDDDTHPDFLAKEIALRV